MESASTNIWVPGISALTADTGGLLVGTRTRGRCLSRQQRLFHDQNHAFWHARVVQTRMIFGDLGAYGIEFGVDPLGDFRYRSQKFLKLFGAYRTQCVKTVQ